MTRVIREVTIDAPVETVWEVLADFGAVYRYNPNVGHSHSTTEAKRGVGAARHCDLIPNGTLEERIVDWTEGRSYLVDIYGGSKVPPFKQALAQLVVRPNGHGAIVTGTLEYSLRFGPIGLLLDRLLVAPRFSKAWARLFAGLKHHVETGQEVDDRTPLELEAVGAGS